MHGCRHAYTATTCQQRSTRTHAHTHTHTHTHTHAATTRQQHLPAAEYTHARARAHTHAATTRQQETHAQTYTHQHPISQEEAAVLWRALAAARPRHRVEPPLPSCAAVATMEAPPSALAGVLWAGRRWVAKRCRRGVRQRKQREIRSVCRVRVVRYLRSPLARPTNCRRWSLSGNSRPQALPWHLP